MIFHKPQILFSLWGRNQFFASQLWKANCLPWSPCDSWLEELVTHNHRLQPKPRQPLGAEMKVITGGD